MNIFRMIIHSGQFKKILGDIVSVIVIEVFQYWLYRPRKRIGQMPGMPTGMSEAVNIKRSKPWTT